MSTLLFSHAACLDHDPGAFHPECPARLTAVLEALRASQFAALIRREAPLAELDDIARVHPRRHVDAVLSAVPERGYHPIDGDTILSPGSGIAALRAAGGVVAAVDAVMAGEAKNAFCAVRPPGHHAEPGQAMGFCLFNNIVVGAQRARAVHGAERVAIIDFDVHHGNGTQAVAERDEGLFYASTHQSPLYPGTGAAEERGLGNIVNAPLRGGAGSNEFRLAFTHWIMPELEKFAPDLLMISAGFDAHKDDPLGGLRLDESDYIWVTGLLAEYAERACGGRVVSALEGGYDLRALATSTAAHISVLMSA
ncbi:MAG TPA: histone deacetylase family protein [Aliidongia sp.]|nr:histone deacetylase family protein [Aliidongia sp.]